MDPKRERWLSKRLSTVLRHRALELKLPISDEGYIPIDILLKHQWFQGVTRDEIEFIVVNNDKKRFAIDGDQIRATQGHSIELKAPILTPITIENADEYPVILHGGYFKTWPLIKKTGLNKMGRTHIHLAKGKFGEVKSGVRKSVEVLIYIDLKKALEAGLEFFESDNGVVLCEGPIPSEYFSHVIREEDNSPFDDDFPQKLA